GSERPSRYRFGTEAAARARCLTAVPAGGPDGHYVTSVWPAGAVPYEFRSDITPAERALFLAAFGAISAAANISFVPRGGEAAHLFITRSTVSYASFSNSIGFNGGPVTISIANELWGEHAHLIHEICHALGMYHEHQRSDRGAYVSVDPS